MKTTVAALLLIAIQMNITIIQSIQSLRRPWRPYLDHSKGGFELKIYSMPKSCLMDDTSYCFEKGNDYPEKDVAKILHNMTDLHILTNDNEYDQREGDEQPDCPSISTDKPIYYIIDESDNVRVVAQMPERFQQIYTVRWCRNEGKIKKETPHFLFNTTLRDHRMECVNMKLNYDFFVLGYDGMSLERVRAKGGIPVCCRCRQMD